MLPDTADDQASSSQQGRAMGRILVIDDDPIMAANLVELLVMEAYEAQAVSNGEDALESISSFQPHLILTDIRLPGMDGETLLRRLRASAATAQIPVVFMTGYAENALSIKPDGYLSKPFSTTEFLKIIEQIINRG